MFAELSGDLQHSLALHVLPEPDEEKPRARRTTEVALQCN